MPNMVFFLPLTYTLITNTIYLIDPRWLYGWFHVCAPLVDLAAKGPPIIDNYTSQLLDHGYNLRAVYVRHVLGMTFLITSICGLLCVWRTITRNEWGICGYATHRPSIVDGAPLRGLYRGLGLLLPIYFLCSWGTLWGVDIRFHDPGRNSVMLHISNFQLFVFSAGFGFVWFFFAGILKFLRVIVNRYQEE